MIVHLSDDIKTAVKRKIQEVCIDDCFDIESEDTKRMVKRRFEDMDIDDCFNQNPFSDLTTEYAQSRFYLDNFDLVVSLL